MIELLQGGAYLIGGTEVIKDDADAAAAIKAKTGKEISKAEAAKNTIAYGILESHNTSGNMDKLKIRFDKLTSHDITFVG
ncbi:MAG: hydratase, partial [Lachnospiraceae bacterium]|nr:hydratase [Lachnospiraceae bacterium]